jgi:hypothetical protein
MSAEDDLNAVYRVGAGTVRALEVFFAQWIFCPNRAVGWRSPLLNLRHCDEFTAALPRLLGRVVGSVEDGVQINPSSETA